MFAIFEPKERILKDRHELHILRQRYGNGLLNELESRSSDNELGARDRGHWRRLLKRARKTGIPGN